MSGSDPKAMKLFKNVIHPCLVMGDPEQEVGELIPLPELHLLMGVGNWSYMLLLKVWPLLLKYLTHKKYDAYTEMQVQKTHINMIS